MSEKTRIKTTKQPSNISYQSVFYSDLSMDNMLYGAIVRSPAKAGIITSISHKDLPEGYFLFTARDVPGNNLIDTPFGKVPIFSEGNISYKGEPLGIIVGPEENKVLELLSDIEIVLDANTIESYLNSIEPESSNKNLNTVTSPPLTEENKSELIAIAKALNLEEAQYSEVKESEQTRQIDKETKEISNEIFSSVIASRKIEKGPCFNRSSDDILPEGIDNVFKTSTFTVEGSWTNSLRTLVYGEPNGAICTYNGDYLTVYSPSQWISDLRKTLTQALHIDPEKIILKKTNTSSRGTNSIWYNSFIVCQAATAAYHTGCSIKLVYSREEQDTFVEDMHPITIIHKTAVDINGRITAMQIKIDVDAGSSNPFIQEVLDRLVIASCGCYNPLNISISATAYRSSNPPSSIDLQLIDTAAFFAIENQLYKICLVSGFTPEEIRRSNIPQCKGLTEFNTFNFNFEKTDEIITALIQQSDFNRKYASYRLDASLRESRNDNSLDLTFEAPLRGIGFSCGFEGSGYLGSSIYINDQTMEITYCLDNTLVIHCPPVSQSIKEIWIQTASSLLKIPPSSISIDSEFSAKEEPLIPEGIYSNISIMISLLKKCCEQLLKKMQTTKAPINIKKTITPTQKKQWNNQTFSGTPFFNTSFAAGAVELELDPCTFREKIRGIWVVINGGKILNVRAAEKTIKLGIQRIFSSLVEDEVISCDNIHISFLHSSKDAMQIGELVYQILPSAFTQALSQALGYTINSIPLHTDSLFKYLSSEAKRNSQDNKVNNVKTESHSFDLEVNKD